jgi:hypothetical protein
MIKHSPAERYLKALIVHPATYDNQYIKDIARELSLDVLGDWYLTQLRSRMKPPKLFYPEDPGHVASQRYLLQEQLEYVFQQDEHMKKATRLLCRPRARELAETMILGGAPDHAVAASLGKRFQFRCEPLAITRFRYYYWDISLLDSVEMRALLDLRHQDLLNVGDKDIQAQYPALHRQRYTDPRVVAAKLPHSPLMGLIAQTHLGFAVKKTDISELASSAKVSAIRRVSEYLELGGPQNIQMANTLAITAEILGRIEKEVSNPEDQLRSDLQRIAIATTPNVVPTLAALSDGNHTTDLGVKPEVQDAEFIDDDNEDT